MTTPAPDEPVRPDEEKKAERKDKAKETDEPLRSSPLFKIVPADPKNNFDFEDVADK